MQKGVYAQTSELQAKRGADGTEIDVENVLVLEADNETANPLDVENNSGQLRAFFGFESTDRLNDSLMILYLSTLYVK